MKRLILFCLWGMIFIISGFAQTQEGRATWYDTTSKGLSASHPNLPFGTRVRVTNLQNDRQVIVTIDNRIPDTPNRIIDIAKAAADNLELNPRGTTPVRIEVIARRQAAASTPAIAVTPVTTITATPVTSTPVTSTPVASTPVAAVAVIPPAPEPSPAPRQVSGIPSVEVQSDSPVSPKSGMVNQTIITFNGMPGYTQIPGGVSPVPVPSVIGPRGIQADPVLTAQEVPVPAPAPVPERTLRTPEPMISAPEAMVSSPHPLVMQPVVVPPVVVPPVLAPPVMAEPVLAPPVMAEPVVAPPVMASPVMVEPVTTEPVTVAPVTTAPITVDPITTTPFTTPMVDSSPMTTPPLTQEPSIPIIPAAPPARSPSTVSPPQRPTVDPRRSVQVLPRMPDARSGNIYRLQVGAFTNEINAREAVFRLREVGFNPSYEVHGGYCRVVITGVRAADIEFAIERIGAAGFGQVLIREEL